MPWLTALLFDGAPRLPLNNATSTTQDKFVDEGTNPGPVSRGDPSPQSREKLHIAMMPFLQ